MITNSQQTDQNQAAVPEPGKRLYRYLRILVRVFLPLCVIGIGIAAADYIKKTGPKPKKKRPAAMTALVEVTPLQRGTEQVIIRAMGEVIPARELVLRPHVSGEVIEMHPEFIQGGILKADEELIRIEPVDYQLDLERKKSQVVSAQYSLTMELGHQDVARREWELLNGNQKAGKKDRELALRKPHLRKARADLSAARAELRQSELNLTRTVISAPFNAVIRETHIEIGSLVSTQEKLAELVGTDEYFVQVSVPYDRLKWIDIPGRKGESGSEVRIRYGGNGYERKGRVIRLMSDLETQGRTARLLVSVPDPLNLESGNALPEGGRPPLLIGDYVHAEIFGAAISDVYRIPRTALRDDGTVWIATPESTLSIRPVEALWRDAEMVLIQNSLKDGDRLIVSDLAGPVADMPLHIAGEKEDRAVSPESAPKKRKNRSHESS